jgi:hypothetical protein
MMHCQDCRYFPEALPEKSFAGLCHSLARLQEVNLDNPKVRQLFVTPEFGCEHFEAKPIA